MFEKLDLEVIFDLVESGEFNCYEYYINECYDVNYQEVLDGEFSSEYYRGLECKILDYINELCEISKVKGFTGIFTDSIKENYTATKSLDYYEKMQSFEIEGKINLWYDFSSKEVEVASIIATRGVGQTLFLFKELELVVLISDLHGILLFKEDSYINKVRDIALSFDVLTFKIKK